MDERGGQIRSQNSVTMLRLINVSPHVVLWFYLPKALTQYNIMFYFQKIRVSISDRLLLLQHKHDLRLTWHAWCVQHAFQ